eukprot:Em0015g561a
MDGAGVSAAGAEKPGSPSLEVDIEVVNSCGDPTEDGEGEEEMDDTPAVDKSDGRYAYVDRGFTSELYKLEICNLPKFIGFQQVKKRFKGLGLNPVKVKIGPKNSWCFVTFRTEEEKQAAMKIINLTVWKKNALFAKPARPMIDPLFRKKHKPSAPRGEEGEGGPQSKEGSNELSLEERLSNAVTPLLRKPYAEQLQMKVADIKHALNAAAKEIRKANPCFSKQIEEHEGLMCALDDIRPSPSVTAYRNKCEFTVGTDPEGHTVVGFRLSSYVGGDFSVVSPETCVHIPQNMKDLVKLFQQYFSQSSLAPFNSRTNEGYWRQVMIRCYSTGEVMAGVQMHPQQLSELELASEKSKIVSFFTEGDGSKQPPTSLYFQCFSRKAQGDDKIESDVLLGEKHVHESLLGMKFQISPDAFFQTNTSATEVLYSLVAELCMPFKPERVYDICCGTGTIGLYLAKTLLTEVIGVEMVEQAVENAKTNAVINGITKSTLFLCGKAEDVLSKQLEAPLQIQGNVIGVVDPPRTGLHPKVVQAIRRCSEIKQLVYVSCNPQGAVSNFVDFCRKPSHRLKGLPFRPVRAIPVDMFPHTSHCEMVVLFERISQEQSEATPQIEVQDGVAG